MGVKANLDRYFKIPVKHKDIVATQADTDHI